MQHDLHWAHSRLSNVESAGREEQVGFEQSQSYHRHLEAELRAQTADADFRRIRAAEEFREALGRFEQAQYDSKIAVDKAKK